ncbi:iron complex transport system permease protein [Propioniferax innocua]|uniref:Iron complex transport system permease protein n=1 Tax=Propioniferax innocua TaxID=1753 RepID=A0A542ZSG8_9ACTN|nr:iron complex transport system permease protein [Propioniferax innocua]
MSDAALRTRPGTRFTRSRVPLTLWCLALSLALIGVLVWAVGSGSVHIPSGDVWAIVWHHITGSVTPWWTAARESIILESRLPRAITAAAVGASLAVAGGSAQAVTRNALADPYLLGVSSGAGFGVVCASVLGWTAGVSGWLVTPAAAFIGGLAPMAVALLVSTAVRTPAAMILTGVATGQVFSALITFTLLVVARDQQLSGVLHWMAGGFGDARWRSAIIPLTALLTMGTALVVAGRQLDLLHVGEDGARALGLPTHAFRIAVLLAVSLLAGCSVAVAGGIGFVGLLVPHVAAMLVGARARRLLPVAALVGAIALVAADTFARSASQRVELPVGVVTSLVGAPIFVIMLWRTQRRAT